MNSMHAYLNGRWLTNAELAIPFDDQGFVLGTTVTEQLRTFAGQIFCLTEHLDRLFHSLDIVGVAPGVTRDEFASLAHEVVTRNYPLLAEGDDLGVGLFVTPGPYATISGRRGGKSTVCLYSFRLPFHFWAEKYQTGESIVISDVEQISPRSWPTDLKCRSRMHYYLADMHAARDQPGSRAILLDRDGFVSEATTANLVLYFPDEGLVSPPEEKILPGISLSVLKRLAAEADLNFVHRDIRPAEIGTAAEAFLCSTSICMLPVTRFQGEPLGTGRPGAVYAQLLAAWNQLVGLDIAEQARQAAARWENS